VDVREDVINLGASFSHEWELDESVYQHPTCLYLTTAVSSAPPLDIISVSNINIDDLFELYST
jgi:hypothetical protein